MEQYTHLIAIASAFLLDKLLGDPMWLPHPIVLFGKSISRFEKQLNKGENRIVKGLLVALLLISVVFTVCFFLVKLSFQLHWIAGMAIEILFLFYGLAGTTLIKEARLVFRKLEVSLDEGRKQVARIVGRDTQQLSEQEIKAATLETMAENLSDGVVAPLFWFAVAGIPGIMTYKMINTMDSMIGYKNERYIQFGKAAAYIDDVANYIPARITAFLMVLVNFSGRAFKYILKFGKAHSSPNAGYPEAALAGILDAQFGGSHNYFGKLVEKPVIGENKREFKTRDFIIAKRINQQVELAAIVIVMALAWFNLLFLV